MIKLIELGEAIKAMQRLHDEDVEEYGAEIREGFDEVIMKGVPYERS